jgi:hypothetical protein
MMETSKERRGREDRSVLDAAGSSLTLMDTREVTAAEQSTGKRGPAGNRSDI